MSEERKPYEPLPPQNNTERYMAAILNELRAVRSEQYEHRSFRKVWNRTERAVPVISGDNEAFDLTSVAHVTLAPVSKPKLARTRSSLRNDRE